MLIYLGDDDITVEAPVHVLQVAFHANLHQQHKLV